MKTVDTLVYHLLGGIRQHPVEHSSLDTGALQRGQCRIQNTEVSQGFVGHHQNFAQAEPAYGLAQL